MNIHIWLMWKKDLVYCHPQYITIEVVMDGKNFLLTMAYARTGSCLWHMQVQAIFVDDHYGSTLKTFKQPIERGFSILS